MISNPHIPAFRYDPYTKKLTREGYDHAEMQNIRYQAVAQARESDEGNMWGVILGTLGRQGNLRQLEALRKIIPAQTMPILLSELSPSKLALFSSVVGAFVQTSCPRLSIDWGYAFDKPLLSPYECRVAVGDVDANWDGNEKGQVGEYPMDFYAAASAMTVARVKSSFT